MALRHLQTPRGDGLLRKRGIIPYITGKRRLVGAAFFICRHWPVCVRRPKFRLRPAAFFRVPPHSITGRTPTGTAAKTSRAYPPLAGIDSGNLAAQSGNPEKFVADTFCDGHTKERKATNSAVPRQKRRLVTPPPKRNRIAGQGKWKGNG